MIYLPVRGYQYLEFFTMANNIITIIIPTLNEEQNIEKLINDIIQSNQNYNY